MVAQARRPSLAALSDTQLLQILESQETRMSRNSQQDSPLSNELEPTTSSPLTYSTRSQGEYPTETYQYDHDSDEEHDSTGIESEDSNRQPRPVAHSFAAQAGGSTFRTVNQPMNPMFGRTLPTHLGQTSHIPTRRFVSTRVPEEMPRVGTKSAPKKFKGEYDYVESFFRQYEQMCRTYNLYDSAEKCERILDYVDRKVERFIESNQAYRQRDWDALKAIVLDYYDAERKDSRYSLRNLKKMVNKWRHKPMKNLETWKKFGREFLTISGWLITNQLLTIEQEAAYYWHGIRKDLRQLIETRYYTQNPTATRTKAIPMSDVNKIAAHHFARFRFDRNLVDTDSSDSDGDSDESSSESDSDSDDDDESSESEDEHKSKKRHKGRDKSKRDKSRLRKKKRKDDTKLSDDEVERIMESRKVKSKEKEPTGEPKNKTEHEVTDLIDKMSRMSITDPMYGKLYYQATHLDPTAALCLRAPELSQPRPFNRPMRERVPGIIQMPEGQGLPQFSTRPRRCFGCGLEGHVTHTCTQLQELISNGIIRPGGMGSYLYADGTVVPRVYGETLVETICKRAVAKAPAANYVSAMTDSEYASTAYLSDSDSVPGAFAMDRAAGKTRITRQTAQDRPSKVPRQGTAAKAKEIKEQKKQEAPEFRSAYSDPKNRPVPQKREGVQTRAHKPQLVGQDINNPLPRPIRQAEPQEEQHPVPAPIPVDVREPRKIVVDLPNQNEDVVMKEVSPVKVKKSVNPSVQAAEKTQAESRPTRRYGVRHTDLQRQVDNEEIVRKVLAAPVTISVQEALAASRNVSESVRDLLKLKRGPPVEEKAPAVNVGHLFEDSEASDEEDNEVYQAGLSANATADTFWRQQTTRDKAALINVVFECGDGEINAIIDSGSQLNIVRRDVYRSTIREPMLPNKVMHVKDANGHIGLLQGLVRRVPLGVGEVVTKGNIFVGEKDLPYELILGRPWTRDNLVSIVEKNEGTFLEFNKTATGERYVLCVYEETPPARVGYVSERVWRVKQPLRTVADVGRILAVISDEVDDEESPPQNLLTELPYAQGVAEEDAELAYAKALQEWQETVSMTYLANRIILYRLAVKGAENSLKAVVGKARSQDIKADALVREYRQVIDRVKDIQWPRTLLNTKRHPELEDMEEHAAILKVVKIIQAYQLGSAQKERTSRGSYIWVDETATVNAAYSKEGDKTLEEGVIMTRLASRILLYRKQAAKIWKKLGLEQAKVDRDKIRSDPQVAEKLFAIRAVAESGWPEDLLDLDLYTELE